MAFDILTYISSPANGNEIATEGSGNVYADLGFDNPVEESLKADLVMTLRDEIERKGLTLAKAAEILGHDESDLSKLLRGRTGSHSHASLLEMAQAIDGHLRLVSRS